MAPSLAASRVNETMETGETGGSVRPSFACLTSVCGGCLRLALAALAVWLAVLPPAEANSADEAIAAAESALLAGNADKAATLLGNLLPQLMADDSAAIQVGDVALRLSRIDQLGGDLDAAEAPLLQAIPHLTKVGEAARKGKVQLGSRYADEKTLQRDVPAPAENGRELRAGLARLYIELGHLTLARGALNRAQLALMKGIGLAEDTVAPGDAMLLDAELSLATAEIRAFRLEPAARRLEAMEERLAAAGAERDRLRALLAATQAEWYFRRYDFTAALSAQQRAYDLSVDLYGQDHPESARAATSLAGGLFNAGQYRRAEQALLRAIRIYETDAVFFAPALATALVNLGHVYYATGRSVLAVTALTRAESLAVASLGNDNQVVAASRLHRGYTRLRDGDLNAAAMDLESAIAIWTRSEAASPRAAAGAQVWLAEARRRGGDFDGATAALASARRTLLPLFGADGYAASDIAMGEGEISLAQGQLDAAVAAFQRAADIRQRLLGGDHLTTLEARAAWALARIGSGDITSGMAITYADLHRVEARIALIQAAQSESALEEIASLRRLIGRYLAIIERALDGAPAAERDQLLALSLRLAQLSRSSAAGTAIAGMGLRFALQADDGVVELRRLQESVLRWQMSARQLTAMAVNGQSDPALQTETELLGKTVTELRFKIAASHPEISAMLRAAPRALRDIQDEMLEGEALVAYAALEEQSYAWMVTSSGLQFRRLPVTSHALQQQIVRLRATLDPREVSSLADIKPYDQQAAESLHAALLAPLDLPDDIRHLIIVADGTLQSLPFAALLTERAAVPGDFAGYRDLPWLILRYDLSFLPEIGALVDLRAVTAPSAAKAPFLGIGDPVLAGQMPVIPDGADSAVTTAALVASLAPLPESRDELTQLADALAAGPGSLMFGAAAAEATLKAEQIAAYRVVAFATHGLMAGDFGRLREPGLALTPPAAASGEDDGLLTVGEIARLQLDADWVVLSACNTAAADGSPGAEGLSGLARAFFFAGSRSLLVSQWEVLSVAAVELTTGIFRRQSAQPDLTRAAALRGSILAMLSPEQPEYFSHPIFWAPFQLVGEGGR